MTDEEQRWRELLGDDVVDEAYAAGLQAPPPPDETIELLRQVFADPQPDTSAAASEVA